MRKLYIIFGILILLVTSVTSGTSGLGYSKSVSSHGTITLPVDSFQSDFEDAYKKSDTSLGGGYWDTIDHEVQTYSGATSDWNIQSANVHTGNKALKLSLVSPGTERAQNNLKIWTYFGPEYRFSGWFKFPSDWTASWYILAEVARERNKGGAITGGKELSIEIGVWPNPSDGNALWFAVQKRDLARTDPATEKKYRYWRDWLTPVIRGEWFHLEWYLKRDATNGIIRVWINGVLEGERLNEQTWLSQDYFYWSLRVYSGLNDVYPKTVYIDDLTATKLGG